MTPTSPTISADEIAQVLITGERNRTEVAQFSDTHPGIDAPTAYQAQRAFVQSKIDAGERLVGYKLGLTSRNKQRAMGVESPLYGRVTSSMLSTYGDPIPFDRFIHFDERRPFALETFASQFARRVDAELRADR